MNIIYKKYLITFISLIITILFCFIIYKSYKISKQDIDSLPIIKSDVEVVKIKNDNSELEEIDVNSFYMDETISKDKLERQSLNNKINDITTESIKTEIVDNETMKNKPEENVSNNTDIHINKNIKNLIVNEKQDDVVTETDSLNNDDFYKAQLIALKNQQQAKNFIEQTKKKYYNLLKNLDIFIMKIDLKEKGVFYRVQVGNFNTKSDAVNFCKEYIKIGNKNITNCIVVK